MSSVAKSAVPQIASESDATTSDDMPNPAKLNDPFDSIDDLDDEFITDYKAPDYKVEGDRIGTPEIDPALEPGFAESRTVRDPFDDDLDPVPHTQRQAFAGVTPQPQTPGYALGGDDDIGAISIPRIAIHFFPDSEDSVQACDTASLDRRMTRAQCVVKRGGIMEAIDTYRNEPTSLWRRALPASTTSAASATA